MIVFSDFDGTFTARDVGNRIFTRFSDGANRRLVEDWKAGLISSRECLSREAEMTRITPDQFYSFLDTFELVPGAAELYRAVTGQKIPFIILSDGLDLYIEYILKRFHLDSIPFYANRGTLTGTGLTIEFPSKNNNGCPRCGSCKGARISEIVGHGPTRPELVFIGDGLSDICALPEVDLIFARGDLLDFCRSNNLTAIEYDDFFDILDWLRNSGRVAG